MNTATVRTLVRTALTTAVALGAFIFVATPQTAQAQGFSVGVHLGQPAYGYAAPGPVYGDNRVREEQFRAHQIAEHEAWERQQAFLRHEEWKRQRFHFDHERREAYDRSYNGWR